MSDFLSLPDPLPVIAHTGGLFVSRGQGIHPQRTINSFELIFVAGGTLAMREEDRRFDLQAGQSLLLWPEREHGGTAPYKPDCSFYWLHFERVPAETAAKGTEFSIPQVATVARPDHLTELFRRFLHDQEARLLQPASAAHLILLMLHEVARKPAPAEEGRTSTGPAAVLARHARQYIVTHLHEPITTSEIARALDCHPDYLGRCFREVYAITVTDAVHEQRLRRARELLMDTNDTVEAIARECGFGNGVIFFRRLFKRQEGMSPTAFRRLYARVYINSV